MTARRTWSLATRALPARNVYGIRVADSQRGYKTRGRAGDITRAQHCRAKFYARNIGWVRVDPADVRKVVLEEQPGLKLSDDVARRSDDAMGRLGGKLARLQLRPRPSAAGSSKAPVAFLMYQQAENAQGRLDSLDPNTFTYKITSKESA